jgi:voltage-gated potassium channel
MNAPSSYEDHVIICGLNRVGYRVVQEFRNIGQAVVVLAHLEDHEFGDLVRSQEVPVLNGDARQPELLEAAGVDRCLALLLVTDDDLSNLDIALTARELRPAVHIVMRVFNDALARKLESSFGIRTAFSTSATAAPTVAAAALMRGVRHALHVGNHLLSTLELRLRADGQLVGRTIERLEQTLHVSVIELHTPGGDGLRPQAGHCLQPDDVIVVVGELVVLAELRDLNGDQFDDPLGNRRGAVLRRIAERDAAQQSAALPKTVPFTVRVARPLRRLLRLTKANLRDADLLLRESREALGPLLVLLLLGTWALALGYIDSDGNRIGWSAALYAMLMMAAFQPVLDLPQNGALQLLFFIWPFVSLYLLGRGALSFALLLLDKRNRRDAWDMALATTYRDHMIVCGLGKVGYRVVQELHDLGYEVVAIEHNLQGPFNEAVRALGVPVLIGDIRQEELLRTAGVPHCLALIIVSHDDLTNLDAALSAREIRPDVHIVMRVFNDALARKLESSFGIRTAFSISATAAPTLAAAALLRGVRHALHVSGRLLSTIEIVVQRGSRLDSHFIGRIEHQVHASVIELRRANQATTDLHPRRDYRLSAGDEIVVLGELHALRELRHLNDEHEDDPLGARRDAVLRRLVSRAATEPQSS